MDWFISARLSLTLKRVINEITLKIPMMNQIKTLENYLPSNSMQTVSTKLVIFKHITRSTMHSTC
jgi:hypothetical protein